MTQLTLPGHVYSDLKKFIYTNYSTQLPHPLLIAQAFCLRFKEHGKKYGLFTITNAVEDIIKNGRNNK
jgi:hypothetical protein